MYVVFVCVHVCGFVHVCVSFTSMVGCVISIAHGDMGSSSGHSTTVPKPTKDTSKHLIGRLCVLASVQGGMGSNDGHTALHQMI